MVAAMAYRHFCAAVIGLSSAASAWAAAPQVPPRLSLNLRSLDGGGVAYHPFRWLTIRRSITPVRAEPVDDVVRSIALAARRPRAYALTGDVHPFGDALRVSLGLREDDNRRLLRNSGDSSDIGTARYAPMMSVGVAGEMSPGMVMGVDLGLVGRGIGRPGESQIVTPADMMRGDRRDAKALRPVVQLAFGYRY